MKNTKNKGGKRKGAGRKPAPYQTTTIAFRVRVEFVEPIKKMVKYYISERLQGDAKRMLAACGFSIGQKVQVFDGQKWEKTGDIGDNECFWIEATITGCNINEYKELLIEVLMVDGRTSLGYYKNGVRHCR